MLKSSGSSWEGRSHVSTFVHSLHLLDLDQRPDWPGVSIQSFGAKSTLQLRVRCVEWTLYYLFELYSVRITKDKLQPFFPPTTSLQSVNLRAALLRQLTDLKKDGVLGSHITLRKTMLDECKGDRFEELLAAFSVVVLKKSLGVRPQVKKENLLPLILSHRKGIQRDLEKRKELDLNARQQHRAIKASQEVLSEHAAILLRRQVPQIPENADVIRSILRENWIGDYAWVDTILNGSAATVDPSHLSVFDETATKRSTLLDDLQDRVQIQNTRLVQWQDYLSSIQQRQQSRPRPENSQTPKTDTVSAPRFTKHQELRREVVTSMPSESQSPLKPHHQVLLDALNREMMSGSAPSTSDSHRTMRHQFSPKDEFAVTETKDYPEYIYETTVPGAISSDPASISTTSSFETVSDTSEDGDDQLGSPTTPKASHFQSLSERTRASLAGFETPKANSSRGRTTKVVVEEHPTQKGVNSLMMTNAQSDRSSLLERTRQSMSMLTSVMDDNYLRRATKSSSKPQHRRSKTLNVVPQPQKRRLERAWSEESLSSAATKDDGNVNAEADYEDVFKSRPRLAMSPNLSPQRTDSDAWLDNQLEQSMNKLTIESSPEY